ncbi:MAG: yjeF-like protein hydroxyethylthiazole kinaserelated protein [Bacilli bacterium]|nr:yjeF-like protein hydroxyethylthiazole kinaserelated protein [Bacilli bacterium]
MFIVNSEEMRRLDRYIMDVIGISAAALIENAGHEVANEVQVYCENSSENKNESKNREEIKNETKQIVKTKKQRWVVFVGKGNNGADGCAAARHLREAGFEVGLVIAEKWNEDNLHVEKPNDENRRTEAILQQEISVRMGIPSQIYKAGSVQWQQYDGIVDALLGTGSKGAPREPYASMIREINASGLPIISIDIPSGLDADTGAVYEPCIRATVTVALAFLKYGLVQYPGAEIAGEVIVRPIGIPQSIADREGIRTFWMDEQMFFNRFGLDPSLPRSENSHKGTFGHVLIAAGTRHMSGAGLMNSHAALRSGCGLASWIMPKSLVEPMIGRLPELMLIGASDAERGDWSKVPADDVIEPARKKDALVIGSGMGRFPQDGAWLRTIWESTQCPLVLDADALNMIADDPDFASWRRRDASVILTPHPGEMARLLGIPVHEVQRDRIGHARRYAVQHGVTLILKGSHTVCATPEGVVYVNTTGNPGMATAGAGDVLAGMLGSLLAQGLTAEQAASLGVYLHGAAGDRAAAKRHSAGSLLASDIIEAL